MTDESWARQALETVLGPAESIPAGPALTDVRLSTDAAGNVSVLVFAGGPFPVLGWLVAREFVDEILSDGSTAVVQCRADTGTAGLHMPPGYTPRVVQMTPPAAAAG